jgi:hypothetical protein
MVAVLARNVNDSSAKISDFTGFIRTRNFPLLAQRSTESYVCLRFDNIAL